MNTPSVQFESVWKQLPRRTEVSTLAEILYSVPRRLTQSHDPDGLAPGRFWALRDVSFALQPGETLGIVGPNGAGKSSVLKLLFRIFRPDRGSVKVRGRVTGLIELGAGFHPMLSGRDNVFINGSILGMSQKEVRHKYESIVEFAEMGDFMDMPVKNYSSGMYARLAFAIAAHADPNVLLVDEVLAVGDASFQARCHDWIETQRLKGCAIVMVTHQMHVVQSAARCLYLDAGRAVMLDKPGPVVARYMRDQNQRLAESQGAAEDRPGIRRVELLDTDGNPTHEVTAGAKVTLRLHWHFPQRLQHPVVTFDLIHDDPRFQINTPGGNLAQLSSGDALRDAVVHGSGTFDVAIDGLHLPIGMFSVYADVKSHDTFTGGTRRVEALRFEVRRPEGSDSSALLELAQTWSISQPTNAGSALGDE